MSALGANAKHSRSSRRIRCLVGLCSASIWVSEERDGKCLALSQSDVVFRDEW